MKLWLAPKSLHIEMGRVEDASLCAKLHAKGFYRGWQQSEFAAFLSDIAKTPIYVAKDKKNIMAGFAIIRIAANEAELLSIIVAEKFQSKGVGAAILRAILDDLLLSPVEKLLLEVEEENVAAIALYKRQGFLTVGERQAYYAKKNGKKANALIMELKLD
jgi:ribosomal-protein-alanine N-acetyltransferase